MEPIIYIDRSIIREGALEELKRRIPELVDFLEEREPQLIAYDFYFNEQATHMTVISVHPDSDSLRTHMEIGKPAFRKFADLIDIYSIEVYGTPDNHVLSLLEEKAAMLGSGSGVEVHDHRAGFLRVQVQDS